MSTYHVNCSCCGGIPGAPCCPDVLIPSTLYMTWTSQIGTSYDFPTSIPLTYGNNTAPWMAYNGYGWISTCYYDSTSGCYTFIFLFCDPSSNTWILEVGVDSTTMTQSSCSPLVLTLSSIGGAVGVTDSSCQGSVGPANCNLDSSGMTGIAIGP